ncbi:MAG: Hpt domain-containing protein [Rhizobiales bacterium]|nr:Hpt domain-containing protein [Hyphomicrobiales bacterium]
MSSAILKFPAPEAEAVPAAVFDEAHFVRQTFGDPDLQQEIIHLFLAQINDARLAFSAPMTTTAWRFLTHTLKGAAASVGANRIAQLASQWELAGSPQDSQGRRLIVEQFNAETAAFTASVQPYIA